MIAFSGRFYLRKGQYAGFNEIYGAAYFNFFQNVGLNPNPDRMRGFLVPESGDISGISMSVRPSSNSEDLQWKTRLHVRNSEGEVSTYLSDTNQPRTTKSSHIHWPVVAPIEKGDLIAISLERIGTAGNSTYYLYTDVLINIEAQ